MFHMTFNNHSGWKLLKACRKCIFSEYLYTLHVCKHLFWVWQGVFFWVWQVLLMWRRKKVVCSTSNAYMNWLKLNMKMYSIICSHAKQWQLQATFILQKTQLHLTPVCSGLVLQANQQAPKDVISCREREAALIFTQELYLHFSRWSLVD